MQEIKFIPLYGIGDQIFHITQESERGVIVDISYSVLTRLVKYNIVFGIKMDDDVWCWEHELSVDKVF